MIMQEQHVAKRVRPGREMTLGPVIVVSAVFHALVFAFFALVPSIGKADYPDQPKAMMFNIEVADRLGTGVGGTPKKGPEHDGRVKLPDPEPEAAPVPVVKAPEPEKKRAPTQQPRKKLPTAGELIDQALRQAVEDYNKEREGDFTRPDGDPNSANPGPSGTPGGDSCAVYRSRSARHIRRSGSVPEAAGKSVGIVVVVGPSGGVISKRMTKSSGVPVADSIAMGLVPRSFGAPPPECGNVTIRVTVKFQGTTTIEKKMPPRQDRAPKKKTDVPPSIDRALQEL